MTLPQISSLIAFSALVVVCVSHRRILFSWSSIGVFWFSHVLFICVGLLVMPWFLGWLGHGVLWSGLDFSLLSEMDWSIALALVVGWMVLVVLFYQFWEAIFRQGRIRIRKDGLTCYSHPFQKSGLVPGRLILVSAFPLLFASAYVVLNLGVFLDGIIHGFIGGDPRSVFLARRASTDNYLFVQAVYNIIPFIAVALWLQFYPSRSSLLRGYAYFYALLAAVFLVLIFQKRPLFIFLLALGLAHLWLLRDIRRSRRPSGAASRVRLVSFRRGVLYGAALFGILVALYLLQTQIGRGGESPWDAIKQLSSVAVVRLFGRMALQPVMVVHYFPAVEGFYGISNIGMLTSFLGMELYAANAQVFEYFRGFEGGRIAMPAFLDFYAAFGPVGWFLSAVAIGLGFNRLDHFLSSLKSTRARVLLTVFSFVFVYYLSQASLARSLMGYGGLIFATLWFLLTVRIGPHTRTE